MKLMILSSSKCIVVSLVVMTLAIGCSGSGGGSDASASTNESPDDSSGEPSGEDGNTTDSLDTDQNIITSEENVSATQNELNDDRFTLTELNSVVPDESGRFYSAGASSILNPVTGSYEFLAGTYSYTEQLEISSIYPDECIVINGGTNTWDSLTARSAFTAEDSGDLVVTNGAGTFLTIPYQNDYYFHYDKNFVGEQPEDLMVNFTGMGQASIQASMPNVETIMLNFDLQSQPITETTVYTWIPNNNPKSYINITGVVSESPLRSFNCRTVDDGEFVLSDLVVQRIGQQFETFSGSIGRIRTEISTIDNVGVRMSSASVITYRN